MDSPFVTVDNNELKMIDYSAWGGFEGFLRDTSNGAGGYAQMNLLKRISPFLAKAIDLTAVAISSLPFEISKFGTDEVIDTSDKWKNEIMCLPNPRSFLYRIASSLCGGKAYVIPQRTGRMITNLQYIAPHTVLPLITTNGLQWFSRASDFGNAGVYSPIVPFPAIKTSEEREVPVAEKKEIDISKKSIDELDFFDAAINNHNGNIDNSKYRKFLKDILVEQNNEKNFTGEMMYFWLPDSDIEIGPAKKHPIGTAMVAAQLDADMDNSVGKLASRNFVAPHLVSGKGVPQKGEREEIENWLNRFMKGAFNSFIKIMNADAMTVIKVGAGMEDFKSAYPEIDRQVIEKIGSAFGIPAAVFMSDKAFASEIDPMLRTWYDTGTFILIYHTIQETLNFQLFHDYGYHFSFNLSRIKAFQKDTAAVAAAFRDLVAAGVRPSLVALVLGIQMPEGHDVFEFDEGYQSKTNLSYFSDSGKDETTPPEELGEEESTQAESKTTIITLNPNEIKDLSLWKQVSTRSFHKGKGAAVDFECKYLRDSIAEPIRQKLAIVENELDLVRAFEISTTVTNNVKSTDPGLIRVAEALEKLAEKV